MDNMDNNETDEIKQAKIACSEELSVIRMQMLNSYPFIGSIAMKLDLIPVRDYRVSTACTDGSRVYVDVAFFESLTSEEKKFLFAHEVWHCVLMHMIRKQSREVNLFNIAADKEINYLLKNDGFTLIDGCCYPESNEAGLSAEQIYELMLKNKNDNSNNGNQFDEHIYDNESTPQNSSGGNRNMDSDGNITDKFGKVGMDKDFQQNPANVDKDFADKMKESIIASAQEVEQRMKGSLPNYIEQIVNKVLTPQFNWKELLAQYVAKINLENKTWSRVNRRHIWNDEYYQGKHNESMKVACLLDTSGSCVDDLEKFMSELSALVSSFGEYELVVYQCDTEIKSIDYYNNNNPFPVNDISKLKIYGGGGSDFRPAFDKICKDLSNDDNAYSIIVAFTDGYIDVPRYNNTNKDIIWVLTNDGTPPCEYGTPIKFND